MRTRLIELSTTPMEKETFINASTFAEKDFRCFDLFTNIADHISDDCIRENDIDYLFYQLGQKMKEHITVNQENSSFTLLPSSKRTYFADKKAELILLVNEIEKEKDIPLFEDSLISIKLEELANDKGGLYVLYDGFVMTLDRFMRLIDEGETLYIGGTLDLWFKNK